MARVPVRRRKLEEQGQQRDRLKKKLESLRALSGIMPGMAEEDYERAERLRSLGYIR